MRGEERIGEGMRGEKKGEERKGEERDERREEMREVDLLVLPIFRCACVSSQRSPPNSIGHLHRKPPLTSLPQ